MTEERALTRVQETAGIIDPAQYPSDRFNVLAPISIHREEVPYLRQSIATVRLDANHEGGDCYAAPGTRWLKDARGNFVPASVSPAKAGLLKIAAAMGIVFQVEDVEPPSHRLLKLTAGLAPDIAREIIDRVKYDTAKRCRIAVRDGSGWRYLQATYVWDLDAQRRKVVRDAKKRAEKAAEKKQAFDVDEYVEDRMDQIIAERDGLAETKAVLRAIRATGIKHAYTREEFARPFVVQRTDLYLDTSDPETRAALAQKALASSQEIFGDETQGRALELPATATAAPDWTKAEEAGLVEDLPPVDAGEEVVEPAALPAPDDDTPSPWQPAAADEAPMTQEEAQATVVAIWKTCGRLVKEGALESMPLAPPAQTASVEDLMAWADTVEKFIDAEQKRRAAEGGAA